MAHLTRPADCPSSRGFGSELWLISRATCFLDATQALLEPALSLNIVRRRQIAHKIIWKTF